MMFGIARKRRCGRRDPRLAAVLGLFSAGMMAAAAFVQRYQGKHETILVVGLVAILIIGLAVIRVTVLNRDGDGR